MSTLSPARVLGVVARTSLLRASRRTSTYVVSLLAFVPALLGVLLGHQGHGATATMGPIAIQLIAPLLVVSMVAGPIGESFEQRTIVYYFTRPVPRALVLVGEWLAYALIAAVVMACAGGFLAIANALTGNAEVSSLVRIPLMLAAEGVVLVGFTLGVATLLPKIPLAASIAVLAVTEWGMPALPGAMKYVSLSYHVGALAGMASSAGDSGGAASPVSAFVSTGVMLAYALLPMVAAMVTVTDRDIV